MLKEGGNGIDRVRLNIGIFQRQQHMSEKAFEFASIGVATVFTPLFFVVAVPALMSDFDIIGAFEAGFVNRYSSCYSADIILC
ncbi:MAG: hypothetical protein ACJAR0_002224 [Candidatus Azotimanducaceae bacterium]|jgi:hypothetical protein